MEYKKQIFTLPEKRKFLEIVKNYSKVVENKHTHSSAVKMKNLTWQKITSEFNSSPQTNFHRTPKQLRRLWMNLKQREREVVARTLHPLSAKGSMNDTISGPNMLDVAHALMTSVDSSMDSDIVLETVTNCDPEQLETSLCLNEESQNITNQETPLLSTVKIEPMSPINANLADTIQATLKPIQNPALIPNNKDHISQQQENINQDKSRSRLQSNLELQGLETQLLKERLRSQREENKSREARSAVIHNLEYQILKEKLREAKAKADLAELYLRRQHYSDGNR